MFDDSCGEIFGPGIFGNDQPERTHRDFTTVVEERLLFLANACCKRHLPLLPVCVCVYLESPRPIKHGVMTPRFWPVTPFLRGHGDSR